MGRKSSVLIVIAFCLLCGGVGLVAQKNRLRVVPAGSAKLPCELLAGAYQIDVTKSDKLYSAVRGATSTVPFADQQQFFLDLSVRLTPPDLLAIECSGNRVTVGSSRAAKVTFVADGRTRQEQSVDGGIVHSRIALTGDTLSFSSTGKAEDNLSVTFTSIDNGRGLRVTRRIYAEQLIHPVIIQSVYNKLSDRVDWDSYGQGVVAQQPESDNRVAQPGENLPSAASKGRGAAAELRGELDDWIQATNGRDIERQMSFYMPQLQAFYLTRNTPRSAVRAEKNRAFLTASSIDIRADEPEILFQDGGRTAVMRFHKQYRIVSKTGTRAGEVVQELRWQRTEAGWRIFSERDVRVIR
ncbi:MAG TPA: hypothetical protein VEV84_16010 [Pyrinomonadaceae bacterium]|nr:hypothetical protein [Pyrinomonadaceae bacterium]